MLQVKALRQALKDVPAAMDKNERFRRVSALIGGSHSKKECYDKYKELKTEAKLKQNASRINSAVAPGAGISRWDHRVPEKNYTEAILDDGRVTLPLGDEFSKSTATIGGLNEAAVKNAGNTVGCGASAASGPLSERSSTLSSWSSHSAECSGQQQQEQQQRRQPRRSTASSTLSSVRSEPQEGANSSDSSTELRGIEGSVGRAGIRHKRFDQMGKAARPSYVRGSERTLQGSSSGTYESPADRPAAKSYGEDGNHDTARGAARCEGELMKVEEVDEVEDFCLEEELAVDPHCAVGVAQARRGGRQGGANRTGRYSQGESSSAGGGIGCEEGEKPVRVKAVTEAEATGVRALVFGDPMKRFNDAWREQGFYFCPVDGLRYGLVQAEGGPCSVLAAVQAFLLEVCLYGGHRRHLNDGQTRSAIQTASDSSEVARAS